VTTRRLALIVLALGLLASLFVAVRRERREAADRNVEIVMDDADFQAAADAAGVNEAAFLTALRKAGLTSLGVSEELGIAIPADANATAFQGGALIAQARLAPLADPLFAQMAHDGTLRADTFYLIAYDAASAQRYATQVPLHFPPGAIRILRSTLPEVWAIRTTSDYFTGEAFGLPADRLALAKREHLLLVPRIQNDEQWTPKQLKAVVATAIAGQKARTIIFFGTRNEVLGYPLHTESAAVDLIRAKLNYGSVEAYDPKQIQLGNTDLARKMPDNIVRVITIAKPELDKLSPEEAIARYLLGVNERNIRVVYLRPYLHSWNGRSLVATNVEMVRRISTGILTGGKHIASASPFTRIVDNHYAIVAASLAVPGAVLLVLDAFGLSGWLLALVLILGDVLLVVAGYAVHHDLLARQALAFTAGLAFPALGVLATGWAFRGDPAPLLPNAGPYTRGVIALVLAVIVTLGGALAIVGLLSTQLTMSEIEQFLGVKYVLVLPALIAIVLYLGTDRFGAKLAPQTFVEEPVRVVQLLVGIVLAAAAVLVLERSGNQGDIAPSAFELSLRAHLTTILQVRPRFKEFAGAWPAVMLLPALVPIDRKRFGWLFALALGAGLGDLIDTFSHIHTPLLVSAERVLNGGVLGVLIGLVVIFAYRRLRVR
jgi:hypothetical protein